MEKATKNLNLTYQSLNLGVRTSEASIEPLILLIRNWESQMKMKEVTPRKSTKETSLGIAYIHTTKDRNH